MILRKQPKSKKSIFPLKIKQLEEIISSKFENNTDLKFSSYEQKGVKIAVFFLDYQVDNDKFQQSLMEPLLNMEEVWKNNAILNHIPINSSGDMETLDEILQGLIIGKVFIYVENEKNIITYLVPNKETKAVSAAETESVILGPNVAFSNSLTTNLNMVRWAIKSTDLVLENFKIGETMPLEVRMVYMKSIANDTDVNTMRQRITDLKVDEIENTIVLKQYIEDSESNIFPQFDHTELVDRFTYAIKKGKVGVLVENSPSGFLAPATLFTFFESTEDLYMRWQSGSFLRIIRVLAVIFSILVTPMYVGAVTFQYSIIPTEIMLSIGQSRATVPFTPLMEALIMEFFLELLREAGARLPTKVGQTMGIVGGIVIGQAAVKAGITSNILIIVVAMSALSSFTIPSYLMSSSIRLLRFPLILLAGLYGFLGIMFGISWVIIHLLRLKSLGRPYLIPIYPLNLKDFNKVIYRSPLSKTNTRAKAYRPKDLIRFSRKNSSKKRDIDE